MLLHRRPARFFKASPQSDVTAAEEGGVHFTVQQSVVDAHGGIQAFEIFQRLQDVVALYSLPLVI